MVEPIIALYLAGQDEIGGTLMGGIDGNRKASLTLADVLSFLRIGVGDVLNLFDTGVSHVDLTQRVLQKKKQLDSAVPTLLNVNAFTVSPGALKYRNIFPSSTHQHFLA